MSSEKKFASLSLPDGTVIELPIIKGTYGPDAIDVSKLHNQTNMFTFDPGFMSTAACESKLTYIDGEQGTLIHAGYDIADLAENCDFLEVAYLLMYGELPNAVQFKNFSNKINDHTLIHEKIYEVLQGFLCDSHPMAMIIGLFGSLSAFYYDSNKNYSDPVQADLVCFRSIAKILTIVTSVYKKYIGQKFVYPRNNLNYSENFLQMMFGVYSEDYTINPKFAHAINMILILHADHEQNASTSTVRLAGSTGADPFACIAAGVASLWGPAHGGANEAVINMLKSIKSEDNIADFIERVKAKKTKLMGFGHRVYKNFDPRAKVLRKVAEDVLHEVAQNGNANSEDLKLLSIAKKLENIALNDEYFISRKLYPNVDFYSGLILKAIGIPTVMFTPIFALARVSGWVAQWKEMLIEQGGNLKIGRPRQIYQGYEPRKFIAMGQRI